MATNLALALGLGGHEVEILHTGSPAEGPLDPRWVTEYAAAGVTIRTVATTGNVVPQYLAPTYAVLRSLRDDPPEIVIADDWLGRAYAPLRLRETGGGFAQTAFIVRCAGSLGWLAEVSGKVPADSTGRFAIDLTERACVALADAVVSPSAFVLDWMRARGWAVPDCPLVIPNFVHSAAVGSAPPSPAPAGEPVGRLAFFGRLREGKGIRVFIDAVNGLDSSLLRGRELVFVGGATARWNEKSIRAALDPSVSQSVAGIRFETALDQRAALDELRRPGTLAIMPYLLDNGPHAVAECIEHGIPFLASSTGGTPEVVATEDRAHALVEPTTEGLREALARVLVAPEGQPPARYVRDPRKDVQRWLELIESLEPPTRVLAPQLRRIAVIVVDPTASASRLDPSNDLVEVIMATSRREGLTRTSAEWVIFVDQGDNFDDAALESLLEAQARSGADVVTCGIRGRDDAGELVTRLFLGSAGALGLIENSYGTIALIRRSLVDPAQAPTASALESDWPLLASLDLGGSRIVSVPEPLVDCDSVRIGTVRDVPGDGLTVLRLFEANCGTTLRDAPRLIAALAPARAVAPVNAPRSNGRLLIGRVARAAHRLRARTFALGSTRPTSRRRRRDSTL